MINAIKNFFGIHTHEFTKWEVVYKGTVRGWPVAIQQRTCKTCGFTQQCEVEC